MPTSIKEENEFLVRLTCTDVTARQLWNSDKENSNLIKRCDPWPDRIGYLVRVNLYVSDLDLFLPAGTNFMFRIRNFNPTIRVL